MKIHQLLERSTNEASKIIQQLESKLNQVNDQIKEIKAKGSTLGHGVVDPRYEAAYKKLVAERRAISEKIRIEKERAGSTERSREFEKEVQAKQYDPEERKQRHNQAKSRGINNANDLRSQHGGWEGLAKHVKSVVDQMTDGGKEKLHVDQIEQLANKLGTTPRTLYKWMERSEFVSVRRNLPSQW